MRQELVKPTRGMEVIEARLGRPLADVIRERYIDQGQSMEAVAVSLGIDTSTLSRWMRRMDIPARIFATDRIESVA